MMYYCKTLLSAIALLIIGGQLTTRAVFGVDLDIVSKLSKEELLQLDRDATDLYSSRFDQLDFANVSYDDHLFRSLRAFRHAVIIKNHDYRYADEPMMEASQGPKVNRELCKQQLETLVSMAKEAERSQENYGLANGSIPISAINFLEANGRTASAVLSGDILWLGAHSTCVRAKIPAKSSKAFTGPERPATEIRGRYCVGHLKGRSWPKWDKYYEDRISIKVGVCLPDSCHSLAYARDEAVRTNVDHLARWGLSEPYNSNRYSIDYLYCLPDEDSDFRQVGLGGKLFVAFCAIWVTFLAYCSIRYSQRVRKLRKLSTTNPLDGAGATVLSIPNGSQPNGADSSTGFDYIKAFSVVANLERLCGVDLSGVGPTTSGRPIFGQAEDDKQKAGPLMGRNSIELPSKEEKKPKQLANRVNLDVINGIRVASTCVVVFGHSWLQTIERVPDSKVWDDRMAEWGMISIMNSIQIVAVFYLISFILVTYLAFSEQKVEQLFKPTFWLRVIANRYFRIVPACLLVFWFAKDLAPYTGSGFEWPEYRTDPDEARAHCSRDSWLTILTISTGFNASRHCLPQAWYLTVDFRAMFVIPFYIMLLAKNKVAGYVATIATIGLSTWRYVGAMRAAKIDFLMISEFKPFISAVTAERLVASYIDVPIRFRTCLMGVLTGHLLYLYRTRQIKEWPRWFRLVGLKVASLVTFMVFFGGPLFGEIPFKPNLTADIIIWSVALFENGLQVAICVCILLLTTGSGSRSVRELFSSKVAKFFSSISFLVYLTHIELMYKFPGFQVDHLYWYVVVGGAFYICASNVISIILHVLYEMPINNFIRYMLRRNVDRPSKN